MMKNQIAKKFRNGRQGLAPADAIIPAPILDQIEISLWKGFHSDHIYPTFEEYLGKPAPSADGRALIWKEHGIIMNSTEKWAHRVIRLQAEQRIMAKLNPILPLFPRRPDGKAAAQLRSVEIAWDFPISHDYDEAENILRKIAAAAIPANKKARLRVMASDKLKDCSDGATNGKLTFYYKSLSKTKKMDNEDESLPSRIPSKNATWQGKIYCKRLSADGAWGIRFETTVLGPKLRSSIGKALSRDLTTLSKRLAGLCFDDFWSFECFRWDLFLKALERSAEYKQIPLVAHSWQIKTYARIAKLDMLEVAIWQKLLAKKISKRLQAKKLGERISGKEFSTALNLKDLLLPR